MSQLLLLNNCVNYSVDNNSSKNCKSHQFTTGPIKVNCLINSTGDDDDNNDYYLHINDTNCPSTVDASTPLAITDDALYHETCDQSSSSSLAFRDHGKHVISSSSTCTSPSSNSSTVLVTSGKQINNGTNVNSSTTAAAATAATSSSYHFNGKNSTAAVFFDDSALLESISSSIRANGNNKNNNNSTHNNINNNINNNNNNNKFLFTSSLYRPSKSKSSTRAAAFKSQAKNLITNPWELLMGNSSSSSTSSACSSSTPSSHVSSSSSLRPGQMSFESVNPRYTSRPEIVQQQHFTLQQQQQVPMSSSPLHSHLKHHPHHLRSQMASSTLLLNVTGQNNSNMSSHSPHLTHHFSNLHLPANGNSDHVYESIDTDSLSSNFNIHEYQQRLAFSQQQQQQQPQPPQQYSASSSARTLIPSDTRILNV